MSFLIEIRNAGHAAAAHCCPRRLSRHNSHSSFYWLFVLVVKSWESASIAAVVLKETEWVWDSLHASPHSHVIISAFVHHRTPLSPPPVTVMHLSIIKQEPLSQIFGTITCNIQCRRNQTTSAVVGLGFTDDLPRKFQLGQFKGRTSGFQKNDMVLNSSDYDTLPTLPFKKIDKTYHINKHIQSLFKVHIQSLFVNLRAQDGSFNGNSFRN